DGIERCALTGAGHARDEREAVALVLEHQAALDNGVKSDRLHRAQLVRDGARTDGQIIVVEVDRTTETMPPLTSSSEIDGAREVHRVVLQKHLDLPVVDLA